MYRSGVQAINRRFPKLPPIAPDANKYSRGSLLVLAGSRRYSGAGVLATLAAERTGAGYVSLATPASAAPAARLHLLCSPVVEAPEDRELGCFAADALPTLASQIRRVNALCCGPGLTVSAATEAFVKAVVHHAAQKHISLLLDADALNTLSVEPTLMDERRAQLREAVPQAPDAVRPSPLVLTPHGGELARLCAAFLPGEAKGPSLCFTGDTGRREAAQMLAEELGAIIVAKGPTTFIACDGELYESSEATPALAKAGTGDVLAGIISSLLAQGMTAGEAALLGVQIHSLAGRKAEGRRGRRSVSALDVIDAISETLGFFEEKR